VTAEPGARWEPLGVAWDGCTGVEDCDFRDEWPLRRDDGVEDIFADAMDGKNHLRWNCEAGGKSPVCVQTRDATSTRNPKDA
jgi:hypothetical protein